MFEHVAALAIGILSAFAVPAWGATTVVFDVPGAALGVYPVSINAAGDITGRYVDEYYGYHGFVRSVGGTVSTFDMPGADVPWFGTIPTGINAGGTIAGHFQLPTSEPQGFVRRPDGSFVVVNVPDSYFTRISGINTEGATTGYFAQTPTQSYPIGFVLSPAGEFVTFTFGADTSPVAINDRRDVAGITGDYGFLRSSDGTYFPFSVPGSTTGVIQTTPTAINADASITGYAQNRVCNPSRPCRWFDTRSFVRSADGTITVFKMPRSQLHGTYAHSINSSGTITGYYYKSVSRLAHGFVRDSGGHLTAFDVPGMLETFATVINDSGVIAGRCTSEGGFSHGFVRLP